MNRWSLTVVALYGAVIIALTGPAIFLAFEHRPPQTTDVIHLLELFLWWPYWVWLGVLLLCQAGLLVVPVRVASRRPASRRSLLAPVLAASFLLGALALGAALSVAEAVEAESLSEHGFLWALGLGLATWAGWAVVFRHRARRSSADDLVTRVSSVLLRASILELLVAVPTHVLARSRNYCCAGFGTFVGISTGLVVMLFAFGPGVYYLYLERWRALHPGRGERDTAARPALPRDDASGLMDHGARTAPSVGGSVRGRNQGKA